MTIISESKQLYLEKVRNQQRKHHPFCLRLLGKLMSMKFIKMFRCEKLSQLMCWDFKPCMLEKKILWRLRVTRTSFQIGKLPLLCGQTVAMVTERQSGADNLTLSLGFQNKN